jgi:methylenetetrahydrofolate--tRNA-(uracil-5-)-methyltransferase
MNINFGLLPPVTITRPKDAKRWRGTDKAVAKREATSARALADIAGWG